ncbi:MAG: FG-GAP repeat domain-containing protein, partial [Usitatibacteraceae bacterium]
NIVLLNDGSGDFTKRPEVKLPRSVFGANQSSQDIVAHDVNGDGRIDLIICGTQGEPGYVGRFLQILINNGDGTFRDESSTRLIGSSSKSTGAWNRFIRLADLNGDGVLDIVLNINKAIAVNRST